MIDAMRQFGDWILGRGEASITIPIFDGALKPNQVLEHAEIVAEFENASDIAADGEGILVADGARIVRHGTGTGEVARFDRPVTAICPLGDGGIAIALDGREVRVR